MAKSLQKAYWGDALFFVGSLPQTTHRIARIMFNLCTRAKGKTQFVEDVDVLVNGPNPTRHQGTFFINEAPLNEKQLRMLSLFQQKVVVHLAIDGDAPKKLDIETVLRKIDPEVPLITLTDQSGDTQDQIVVRVLSRLRSLNSSPIPHPIVETAITLIEKRKVFRRIKAMS